MSDINQLMDSFEDEPPVVVQPCDAPANHGPHVCWVGGGAGYFSEDHGRNWTCANHRPKGFYPSERELF